MVEIKNKIVVNIHGPICSGKTTVSRLLHEKISRAFIISGDRIKWLISDYKAQRDRGLVSKMVFDVTKRAVEEGLHIIKDSNYMLWVNSELPNQYEVLFSENKYKIFQYNLEAPLDVLLKRLEERVEKFKKVSVKTPESFMEIYNDYQKMKKDFPTFDSTKMSPDEICEEIIKQISLDLN